MKSVILALSTKSVDIVVYKIKYVLINVFIIGWNLCSGQSTNDILNILTAGKVITQEQADSVRAEYAINQQASVPDKVLRVDFEFRPRSEYRNGYQLLRNDSSTAAFFTNQRSRLNLNYTYSGRFVLQFSVQDLRVWGQQDPRSTAATLQVFEAWAEPYITYKFSVRAGRQRLVYDNQRLFAENDWRLSGAVHDALTFRYNDSRLASELALAFNQTSERYFGTDFVPAGFTNYKFLVVHYLKYSPTKDLILTAINSTDGFQSKVNKEHLNYRYTLGGRIEYTSGSMYGTISAYYQGGENPSGSGLSAWYFQPEMRYTANTGSVVRLGVEYFTGTENNATAKTDHSFVPLYGVAHRFNGSMDLITRFPTDVGGAGLINPYLFLIHPLSKKLDLRADFHTFHSQTDYLVADVRQDRYLGFENDFLLTFKPNQVLKLDAGFSYMLPSESFALIKGAGNPDLNLTWAYICLTFKPVLFTSKIK